MIRYTVIKLIPDTLADESINVGIAAFDSNNKTAYRFLTNWTRVENFAGQAVVSDFLKPWLDHIGASDLTELEKTIEKMKTPYSSITLSFTDYRGSMDSDLELFLNKNEKLFFKIINSNLLEGA